MRGWAPDANIGAGTITCNYDGFDKHFTDIGAGAFIGSNTALVAPVTVQRRRLCGRRQRDDEGRGGRCARGDARRAEGNSGLGGEIPHAEEGGKSRGQKGK